MGLKTDQSDRMTTEKRFELFTSRQFVVWMAEQRVSLAFTTYQAGKVFLLGASPQGKLSVFERTLNRCMGMWSDAQTVYISTLYQLWRFENVLAEGELSNGYDRVYVPQVGYITGDLDIHDIAVDHNGDVIFANTLMSCLARVSETHSMSPCWKPPFISRLAVEDRAHLNGLAMRNGKPAFVTCVSQSDVADGWRDRRTDGGVVIDVASNEIIVSGLSMPHSPRWYQDKLWLLDSGNGYFGYVDVEKGDFIQVAFCPGYLRGLAFIGDFAVIGSSLPRDNKTFQGLGLEKELKQRDADPRCGLFVVDLKTGEVPHWLRIEGLVNELYDVCTLPGVRRPMAIGFQTDEIRRMISIGPESSL